MRRRYEVDARQVSSGDLGVAGSAWHSMVDKVRRKSEQNQFRIAKRPKYTRSWFRDSNDICVAQLCS